MRRAFALLLLGACGGPAPADDFPIFDASVPDATLRKDASPFGDGGPGVFDAPVEGPEYNGGGPFLCANCVCDGTSTICGGGGGGGGMPVAGDASFDDAGFCDPEAGQPYCLPIPVACLPQPTCACIDQWLLQGSGCICAVTQDGNGFYAICPPRP